VLLSAHIQACEGATTKEVSPWRKRRSKSGRRSNRFVLIVGAGSPTLNGYGTWGDFGIGMGVLGVSVVLYVFRQVVQDKQPGSLREETPRLPDDGPPVVPPPVTLPAT
jgi:hypothetical protein